MHPHISFLFDVRRPLPFILHLFGVPTYKAFKRDKVCPSFDTHKIVELNKEYFILPLLKKFKVGSIILLQPLAEKVTKCSGIDNNVFL